MDVELQKMAKDFNRQRDSVAPSSIDQHVA